MTAPLRVPSTDAPVVSIVIVTFNAWEWTERALQAVVANTDVAYELIAVDNASSDGTADALAGVEGAVVLRNDENRGFGVAAMQGVMRSRAPYVLLLNSDALVEPGYAQPLVEVLDRDADVAAVAARLLHTDGSLQEAGSVLWGDGRADNVGDGDRADAGEYLFRRDVDYASAACMLVRRSAFLDAGGFDPVYHPAYFEDADLCMRWREQGLRVVYQPRSTAVHKRWASTDMGRARELIARNLPVFLDRWRHVLGERPSRPERDDRACVLALRDAECAERVLLITDGVPDGSPLVDALRRQLSGQRLTVVFPDSDQRAVPPGELADQGVEVITGVGDLPAWLAGRRHHHTAVLVAPEVSAEIVAALADTQPASVVMKVDPTADPNDAVAELARHGIGVG
jgi:GT2 family glycosyltransferase